MLVAARANDVRCRPWHSRKFIAQLHHDSGSQAALLRVWASTGHGTGRSARTEVEQTAEWLGFLMKHLDLEPA